jgi:Tfp pilus assembly protein PilE
MKSSHNVNNILYSIGDFFFRALYKNEKGRIHHAKPGLKNSKEEKAMRNISGLTVLEVMLAIVIISITSVAVTQFLYSFNRLYGKGIALEQATTIVRDEAEFIKAKALQKQEIEEEDSEKMVDSRNYRVQRIITDSDSLTSLNMHYTIKEIQILVTELRKPDVPIISVRFLQGMYTK